MTSSMPWKRASQLRQCPADLAYCNKNPPLFLEADVCSLLRAHPGAQLHFADVCFTIRSGYPLKRTSLSFIITQKHAKYKLMLVFVVGIWLNRHVQKHARSVEVSYTILFPPGGSA